MNFQSIVSLALTLLGKREELVSVVKDIIAVWNKVKTLAPELVGHLEAVTKTASTEYSINWLQESLNKLLGLSLTVDGKYGQATQDAVKQFQSTHGLTPDGWAGVQTQAAIVDALK